MGPHLPLCHQSDSSILELEKSLGGCISYGSLEKQPTTNHTFIHIHVMYNIDTYIYTYILKKKELALIIMEAQKEYKTNLQGKLAGWRPRKR